MVAGSFGFDGSQTDAEEKSSQEGKKESKLSIVRRALETNPEVAIISFYEKKCKVDPPFPNYLHEVDYVIAPKNGLYTAGELQEFMEDLVPELEIVKDDSRFYGDFEQSDTRLYLGKLYFEEKIGEERILTRRIIKSTDVELSSSSSFIDNEKTIEADTVADYKRRIQIKIFPSEKFARDILETDDVKLRHCWNEIDMDIFERYRPKSGLNKIKWW